VYTPVVWKIIVPPRLHIFLRLLTNNKIHTRDNLAKRKHVEDLTCLFCSEVESVHHVFSTAVWLDHYGQLCLKLCRYQLGPILNGWPNYGWGKRSIKWSTLVLQQLSGPYGNFAMNCIFRG
jgi:hypothetical protein